LSIAAGRRKIDDVQWQTDGGRLQLQQFQTHSVNGHALMDLVQGRHESNDFQIWVPA